MPARRKCPACGKPFPKGFAKTECPACGELLRPARKGTSKSIAKKAPPAATAPTLQTRTLEEVTLPSPVHQAGRVRVYRLPDASGMTERTLAIVAPGDTADAEEHLRERVGSVALAKHPCLPVVVEHGEADTGQFLLTEWIAGAPLADDGSQMPLPATLAARWVSDLAAALDQLHRLGLVPEKVAAADVLVTGQDRVVLAPSFLAELVSGERADPPGRPGMRPPESFEGAPASIRGNLHSLGALLHLLLTGSPPFRATTATETERLVRTADPPPPSLLNPLIPRELDVIVARCLEKEPARRYDTAQALAADLERFLRGDSRPAGWRGKLAQPALWFRRRPARALAVLLLFGALLGLAVSGFDRWNAQQARLAVLLAEQARTHSHAGETALARQCLAEAARIQPDAALRRLGIEILTRPHLTLQARIPFGRIHRLWLSPDGGLLAVAGEREQGPDPSPARSVVAVYALPDATFLGDVLWDPRSGPPRWHPKEPWLAVPESAAATALWVPRSSQPPNHLPVGGLVLFNPAGSRVAVGGAELRVFDLPSMGEIARRPQARPVAWISNEELILRAGPQAVRWDVRTGLSVNLGVGNERLLAMSDNGQLAAWRVPRGTGATDLSIRRLDDQSELWRPPGISSATEPVFFFRHGGQIAFAQDTVDAALIRVLDVRHHRHLGSISRPGLDFRTDHAPPRDAGAVIRSRAATMDPALPDRDFASAITPDGRWLAAALAGPTPTIEVQDLREGLFVGTLTNALAPHWQPAARKLAAVERPEPAVTSAPRVDHACVWELRRPAPVVRGEMPAPQILFSDDGTHLAAGGAWIALEFHDRTVAIRETDQTTGGPFLGGGSPERAWGATHQIVPGGLPIVLRAPDAGRVELPAARGPATLAFSPDHRHLIVARAGWGLDDEHATNRYELYDLTRRQFTGTWPAPNTRSTGRAGPVVHSPDGRWLASACFVDRGVELLSTQDGLRERWLLNAPREQFPGTRLSRWLGHSPATTNSVFHRVTALRFTGNGQWLVAGTADGWITVCDPVTGDLTLAQPEHRGAITGLAVNPAGDWIASSAGDGLVRLTRLQDGAELASWRGRRKSFTALGFSPDGSLLAGGTEDGLLQIWDLRHLREELKGLDLDW